jgi:hypothetical protein
VTLHALIQYLRYRWQAKGRHGTHSPFVYRFVEEVLRKKDGDLNSRVLQYADAEVLPLERISQAGPNNIVFVPKPHANREATAAWNAHCARPDVTLSIDLYHTGLLLFRKEFKRKQHFILR